MKRMLGSIALLVALVAVAVVPAFANGGGLVGQASWKVYTIDSKVGGGFWADLVLNTTATIYEVDEDFYKVVVVQNGTFSSWAGDSPGATGTIGEGVTGTVSGGFTAYVYGDLGDLGDLGSFDYDCDRDGNCPSYVSWRDILFEEYGRWWYDSWGWTYTTCDGRMWVNASAGNQGDITGGPISCRARQPLVDMYVFYSESGFYEHGGGTVNTCSIFVHPSLESQPATDSVERWCTQVPEDMIIACAAPIYDDGGAGTFACDGFLKSVGERRAALRDDIQGPEFDLLPKIQAYLGMLRELGYIE